MLRRLPKQLPHDDPSLVANPSAVVHGDRVFLYYTTDESINDDTGASSYRRELFATAFGPPEAVGEIPKAADGGLDLYYIYSGGDLGFRRDREARGRRLARDPAARPRGARG